MYAKAIFGFAIEVAVRLEFSTSYLLPILHFRLPVHHGHLLINRVRFDIRHAEHYVPHLADVSQII